MEQQTAHCNEVNSADLGPKHRQQWGQLREVAKKVARETLLWMQTLGEAFVSLQSNVLRALSFRTYLSIFQMWVRMSLSSSGISEPGSWQVLCHSSHGVPCSEEPMEAQVCPSCTWTHTPPTDRVRAPQANYILSKDYNLILLLNVLLLHFKNCHKNFRE